MQEQKCGDYTSDASKVENNVEQQETGLLYINVTTSKSDILTANSQMNYTISVGSNMTTTLHNVEVKCVLPEGISFDKEANEGANYNEKTRTVTWNFGTLSEVKYIEFIGIIDEPNEYGKEIKVNFSAVCDETKDTSGAVTSSTIVTKIQKEGFTLNLSSNILVQK